LYYGFLQYHHFLGHLGHCKIFTLQRHQICLSFNALYIYLGGVCFDSRLTCGLFRLRCIAGFLRPSNYVAA
jgi:hypothetical protein